MGKILGEASPGSFAFGLVALGVGILLIDPAGWADWTAVGLFVFGGGQLLGNWGWWRDLSP